MKRTRDTSNDLDLYSATDELEVNEYNISCIMYSCGLDGSTVHNLDIDSVIAAINECYWHKNNENTDSDGPLLISAASLVLRKNHSILLKRLRQSHSRRNMAKGILGNG